MWEYSEKVIEYYRNPKNVGEIDNADAIGEVGSLSCGDALKLYLKIDNNGIIQDAKFQTFGCGSAVASSSALTEMIIGKHIDEAEKISNQEIVDFLGGLPDAKLHCSVMGQEALEAAISNYKGIPVGKIDVGRVVCKCFGTTEEKLRQVIRENNIDNLDGVQNFCKAGGGCGNCKHDILEILNDEIEKRLIEQPKKVMSKTQMIIKVNNVLENIVAPELRKDGGDIELIDIENNKIFVKLKGSCKNCPSHNLTLKNFVENKLKELVSQEIEVIEA